MFKFILRTRREPVLQNKNARYALPPIRLHHSRAKTSYRQGLTIFPIKNVTCYIKYLDIDNVIVYYLVEHSNWTIWTNGCDFCTNHSRWNTTDVCKEFCKETDSFKVRSRDCLGDGMLNYISSNGTRVAVKPSDCESYSNGILEVAGK